MRNPLRPESVSEVIAHPKASRTYLNISIAVLGVPGENVEWPVASDGAVSAELHVDALPAGHTSEGVLMEVDDQTVLLLLGESWAGEDGHDELLKRGGSRLCLVEDTILPGATQEVK